MNVEIGTVAVLFLFGEYLLRIFGNGSLQCTGPVLAFRLSRWESIFCKKTAWWVKIGHFIVFTLYFYCIYFCDVEEYWLKKHATLRNYSRMFVAKLFLPVNYVRMLTWDAIWTGSLPKTWPPPGHNRQPSFSLSCIQHGTMALPKSTIPLYMWGENPPMYDWILNLLGIIVSLNLSTNAI